MSSKNVRLATEIIIMGIIISVILLFVGIGLLVFVHACIVRRSNSATERSGSLERRNCISQDDLEKLPSYDFVGKSKGSSPVDCAVCLENFRNGEKCRLLPICKHNFHAKCVDEWLMKTPICPICRSSIADSTRAVLGPGSGEESSHFSDSSMDTRRSLTTDSSHFSNASIEFRESQAQASSGITNNDTLVELRQRSSSSLDSVSEPTA